MQTNDPRPGFWLETEQAVACEIARRAGYDLVLIDMEHGAVSDQALERIVPYAQGLGLEVHVRVAAAERVPIQHALDAGADAVVLPQIRDLSHAAEATALAKYPPLGGRGIGYNRTMGYSAPTDEWLAEENRRRLCYAMIETPGALEAANQIAALPTVDGLFIGPADLSLGRGRGVFRATDADLDDIGRIAEAARANGKRWAIPALNPRVQNLAVTLEAAYVTLGDDVSALVHGFDALRRTMPR